MANNIEKITINFVKRNARKRGPTSSDNWNDQGEELATDLTTISSTWNNNIVPLLASVPNGTNDLNAFEDGLSGKTLYVDNEVTGSDNSAYWNTGNARPKTIKEQFDDVYTQLANSIEDLQGLITANIPGAALISIKDANNLFSASNVEDALQEVMDLANSYSAPDHGSLSGLNDDDHTQYLLANGNRNLTGNLTVTGTASIGSNVSIGGTKTVTGISTHAAPIRAANGTQAAPSYSFTTQTGSGFTIGVNSIPALISAGTMCAEFYSAGFAIYPQLQVVNGSIAFGAPVNNTLPLLKASGTTLRVRLGDDSAYTNLEALRLGLGVAPQARLHTLSEAADTIPTAFTDNDLVIGRAAASGASSGAVFFRYDSTNNVGFIGSLSPGAAWRNLVVGAALTSYQNASGVSKAQLPGNGLSNVALASDIGLVFSSTTTANGSNDAGLTRTAANRLKITNGSTGNGELEVSGTGAANGQSLVYGSVTTNVTLNTGSTTTNGPLIPANATVLDVVGRVTTPITTAANYSVGVSGATTRYVNASTSLTGGSTFTGAAGGSPMKYVSATNIVVTTNANPGAGAIRITVFYFVATPPTS